MLTLSTNNVLIRVLTLAGTGAVLLSTLGLAKAKAQRTDTTTQFDRQLSEAQLLAQRVIPPLNTRLPARAYLGSVEPDSVSVTLTNNSPAVITYQSASIPTETLELMPGEQQTFDDINAPMNLVFYQKDGGFTSAEITNVNPRKDSFEVELTGTDTLNEDNRTVVLLSSGNIYIY